MTATVAIYPGSFDPPTNGHVDIIERGLKVFDRIVVAVATNIKKKPLFTKKERVELIHAVFADDPRVEVESFDGLLVNYMRHKGSGVVIRGLRAVSDFEYEFQMATMNRKLYPGMETFFLMSGEGHFYLSSQVVREVAQLEGSVKGLVPDVVVERLREKLEKGV